MGWLSKVRSTIHKDKSNQESAGEANHVEITQVDELAVAVVDTEEQIQTDTTTKEDKEDKKAKKSKKTKKERKDEKESEELELDASFDQEPVDETKPLMIVSGVERSFQVGSQKLNVLKGINMTLYPKQLIMLRGRSGSGKTTLLNILGGLDQPTEGEVLFRDHPFHLWNDDQRTEVRRREIGYIFQTFALMPLLSAYENVELGLRMAGVPRHLWKHRVRHCLQLVGLEKRMHHRPFEMSGGEQQRVAIAKAIVHRPNLLLADEPTADLDSQMSAQIMSVFRSIIDTEKVTICMTTHDPTILEVADHVLEMVDGKFIKQI
ncbi:ABC transporter ATP-binding protein [Paenibacillus albiflavus]|uniref:ABC transporter ATP-binding protein n=1 Tax=Paenibacillus albiflavus TaxID=2545760 RepID=A0A4R4E178_9BACL|nr:ABC transporter ATP-binding protein [Paenibacillus albiflavus]TCZ71063.1 ABC transporter ATP-binding protein [Paenibacillus albiflavus]